MTYHSFNSEIAKDYNVDIAILVSSFDFWIERSIANKINNHDGSYWTYNSMKALSEMFDYFSESQIRRILNKMVDEGIIKTGNYNKSTYDRTAWYAFTDGFVEKYKSILRIGKFHLTNSSNGSDEIDKPIPDPNTDSIPDPNTDKKFNFKTSLLELGVEEQIVKDWLEVRRKKKASNTQTAFNGLKTQIEKSGLSANECIRISVERDWKGFKADWIIEQSKQNQERTTARNQLIQNGDEPYEWTTEEK